jgi:hypothetical protein
MDEKIMIKKLLITGMMLSANAMNAMENENKVLAEIMVFFSTISEQLAKDNTKVSVLTELISQEEPLTEEQNEQLMSAKKSLQEELVKLTKISQTINEHLKTCQSILKANSALSDLILPIVRRAESLLCEVGHANSLYEFAINSADSLSKIGADSDAESVDQGDNKSLRIKKIKNARDISSKNRVFILLANAGLISLITIVLYVIYKKKNKMSCSVGGK